MGNENDSRMKESQVFMAGEIMGNKNTNPNQNNPINNNPSQNNNQNNTQAIKGPVISPGPVNIPPLGTNTDMNSARSYRSSNKYQITLKMLKDAFKNYSIDGQFLNKKRFNDAIESLFRFPIPEMHYTYLSEKIYYLLDDTQDGKIQEDEFIKGFSNVLKDSNFRLLLSMMAMMELPDKQRNYIEINEIKEFFYKSYIQGYKHLGWQIIKNQEEFKRNNQPIVNYSQLALWADKHEKKVKSSIEEDLKQFDPSITTSISFHQFKNWIYNDKTIYLQYGSRNISIATSLIGLDNIDFVENA